MIVPKDIKRIFWHQGVNYLTGVSSLGNMTIDQRDKILTIYSITGTRHIKGKSVNELKELADHFHVTHLFDNYKLFVKV